MLPRRWRDALTVALTGFVLVASALAWLFLTPEAGFTVITGADDTSVEFLVGDVTPGSPAAVLGVRPGSLILGSDGYRVRSRPVTTLDRYGWWGLPDWGRLGSRQDELSMVPDPDAVWFANVSLFALGVRFQYAMVPYLLGVLVLVVVAAGLAGERLSGMVGPLAAASAVPLLADPLASSGIALPSILAVAAPALASLLLADAIAARMPRPRWRSVALGAALVAAAGSVAFQLHVVLADPVWSQPPSNGWWARLLLQAAVALVPMVLLVAASRRASVPPLGNEEPSGAWLLAAACAPVVACYGAWSTGVDWVAWLLVPLYVTGLVAIRAANRRLARARLQRDLVVTVTEAERARLAADLHDVALQELTLLIRRLDASGDADAAARARSISDRLRELCGQLRLPILDELGAGPALEWLVEQVSSATGTDVRLERADPTRPPAGVELAVFRVAQEAISNAVKHGGPPIVVRYVTGPSSASLSVDDAGPGIDIGPSQVATRPGHYGLSSMQQRAEQIGALLSVRAWPAGGTRVSLEWKAS